MRFSIKVIPRSSKNDIIKQDDGSLKAYLTTAPVDNKANKALIGLLADYLDIKKSHIKIVTGKNSRKKIVEILRSPEAGSE